MKHDYRKDEKELYGGAKKPTLVTVPAQKFVMISGKGDPNQADFGERVGVLFPLAYAIKMRQKALGCEYAVYPLEGLWTSETADVTDKSKFIYTIMVRQPDFVTQEMFDEAMSAVLLKKPHPLLAEVSFGTLEDGLCVELLHKGSFDDEPASFAQMDAFAQESGYERLNHVHREIYLNDPRKTAQERRKTILRFQAKRIVDNG